MLSYSCISELDVGLLAVEYPVHLVVGPSQKLLVQIPEIHDEQHARKRSEYLQDHAGHMNGRRESGFTLGSLFFLCLLKHPFLKECHAGLLLHRLGKTLLTRVFGSAESSHELRVCLEIDYFKL